MPRATKGRENMTTRRRPITGKRLLKAIAAVAIGTVVIYFIAKTLRDNGDQLRSRIQTLNYSNIVFSYCVLIASSLLLPWVWRNICGFFDVRLGYRDSLQILFLSYITRLVPGRVLTLLSQVAVAKEKKVPAHISVATAVIYQLFSTLIGVQVFLVSVLVWPGVASGVRLLCAALFTVIFVVSLWSRVLETLVAAVMRLVKKPSAEFHLHVRDAAFVQLLLWLSWLVYWYAIHLLLNSFMEMTFAQSGIVTGIQAASALVGYYTFISPAGLGVREGTQIAMLGRHFLPAVTVLIPVVLRVWMTIGDVLLFLVGVAVRGRGSRR